MQMFKCNDVEIEAPDCTHCGRKPTEADAMKLVKQFKDSTLCAVCRLDIPPTKIRLKHFEADNWGLDMIQYDTKVNVDLWLNSGRLSVVLHLKCAAKVFPAFYEEGGKESGVRQVGTQPVLSADVA